MLSDLKVGPSIPAADLERAKKFYTDVLGLKIAQDQTDGVLFDCGAGTQIFVYPTKGAGEAWHTLAAWEAKDLDAEMEDLKARGVKFEDYDFPGLKTVNGVAEYPEGRGAWFKDSEGNTLALVERK
jgi:predicted enzyme related to lactoylglutathione lyase